MLQIGRVDLILGEGKVRIYKKIQGGKRDFGLLWLLNMGPKSKWFRLRSQTEEVIKCGKHWL